MTRTFILRLLGVFSLALGLSLAVTAGSASAQIAMGGPYGPTSAGSSASQIQAHLGTPGSQIQAEAGVPLPGSQIQGKLAAPARAQAGAEGVTAQANCGWYAPNRYAYYNHCGPGRISINVEFWWGAGSTRSICVSSGLTNLSDHWALQGGLITYAYYNGRGC
jgi:hypothetical protein